MPVSQIKLAENLAGVQQKIIECANRSGRDVNDIRLIAVSKTRSLDEVKAIAELGQCCFGENTIQDAMTKISNLNSTAINNAAMNYTAMNYTEIEWHYIGHLQSKKAGKIPGYFQWIHSVDSLKLAQKLSFAMRANAKKSALNCLIQVNVSNEQGKSGLSPVEVGDFIGQVLQLELPCVHWRGLMTIGIRGDEERTRDVFAQLKKLQEKCVVEFGLSKFDQLSMGMSDDYCVAIEEGATMIRLGTSIFGQR